MKEGSGWRAGVPKSYVKLKKETPLSRVTVAAVLPVTNERYPGCMSVTILGPMSHVKFKKYTCRFSLKWPCRLLILRKSVVAMANLRDGCVALSFLGVYPHNEVALLFPCYKKVNDFF